MHIRVIIIGLGLTLASAQAGCSGDAPNDGAQSGASASTVEEDRAAVQRAQLECLKCSFNALWAAASIYLGGGIGGNASTKYGVILRQLTNLQTLLAKGEDGIDNDFVRTEINSVFQALLLVARQELAEQGLSGALLGRIQGILNVVTTVAQCGEAIFNGSVLLVDTSIKAYNEVRDALAFDITRKLENDSADVAQGRDCVASTTFWSRTSYYDQCVGCCNDNAGGRTGCLAVCNAEYKSSGWFD